MATAAFKSTTKRSTISSDDSSTTSTTNRSSSSSNQHRRARSLSRFSRRLPDDDNLPTPPQPRGNFVNTVRGSGFPEISLDDLAVEFFHSPTGTGAGAGAGAGAGGGDRGRSVKRGDDVISSINSTAQRRGRSVSRQGVSSKSAMAVGSYSHRNETLETSNNSRRRRSISVVRRSHISDSESDRDLFQNSSNRANLKSFTNGNSQNPILQTPIASNNRKGLRRSFSQKDLKYHDGYSSHSSALTDDEGRDSHSSRNGTERTIRAVYSQNKADHPTGDDDDANGGLYEAMRKELRYAVEEIKIELEQAVTKSNPAVLSSGDCLKSRDSDILQAASATRRNYSTKLEKLLKSEQRKQDLLTEIVLEDQRGRETSDVVNEFLSGPNNTVEERPYRPRKRSNDRTRVSKRLTEEAEKYFEDFISNVEETDISSIDGERSDTSSTLGGVTKREAYQTLAPSKPLPVEMDGVALPWLQWETTNDASPLSYINKSVPKATQRNSLGNGTQGPSRAHDLCNLSTSSYGSSSSASADGFSMINGEDSVSKREEHGKYWQSKLSSGREKGLQYDIDEYLMCQPDEEIIFERWRQRQRISSGCLLLCNQMHY
ncbi:hypothetical protein ACFE04_031541 [Oxalis oulophora]